MAMEKTLIREVTKWVKKSCSNADHLIRTGYWVKKLNPEASDELIVACITHDIERAFPEGRTLPSSEQGDIWDNREYLLWHGKRSADIVAEYLKAKGVSEDFIQKVSQLIVNHEIGGNDEKNLIKDADSISFLEVNIPLFLSFIPQRYKKDQVRQKVDYMFNRITSSRANELARPFYQKALDDLTKLKCS